MGKWNLFVNQVFKPAWKTQQSLIVIMICITLEIYMCSTEIFPEVLVISNRGMSAEARHGETSIFCNEDNLTVAFWMPS